MPHARHFGFGRVNLLKKVKVGGEWKFCPAVIEPGRKLNDLVRVRGQIETHAEGTYYLEWREQGKRRRQPVRNRALVFEQARLKALELEAQNGPPENALHSPAQAPTLGSATPAHPLVMHQFPPLATVPHIEIPTAQLMWRGIESYLQEIIGAAVRSQLASCGFLSQPASPTSEPLEVRAPSPPPITQEGTRSPSPKTGVPIAEAIESYLKDVKPPQREPKTYNEYRLVLYKFRDTCVKQYIEEIDRADLLEFRRQLYSLGNEARKHIAHWRSVKFTDHWEEEQEDGTRVLHDRERFSHELTLVFANGKAQVLTHEKKDAE